MTSIAATTVAILSILWAYHAIRGSVSTLTRDATAPYGRFVLDVRQGVVDAFGLMKGTAALRRENAALSDEVEELRVRLLVLDELQHENADLRKALGLGLAKPEYLCAEVVSRGGSSGWWKTVRINKGTRDGVVRNCPVLNTSGLVGRIVATSSETSDVLLLTDVNSKLSCYIDGAGPGARGILSGASVTGAHNELDLLHVVEPMSLAYLDKSLVVRSGAKIITSGIGGLYPRGLPVGEVVESSADASGLFQRAKVAPYVDFASLDRVFVVLGRDKPHSGEVAP